MLTVAAAAASGAIYDYVPEFVSATISTSNGGRCRVLLVLVGAAASVKVI